MTDKEALKIVNECIEEGKIVQEAFDYSFFYTVKEALEKQVPKKSIAEYRSVLHYICPNCNCTVKLYYDSPIFLFCKHCGQAIDWSEVENEIENND